LHLGSSARAGLREQVTAPKALDGGERDTQRGGGFRQGKKVACTLASVARGRPVKAVCDALGVARSNIMTVRSRPSSWKDRRRDVRSPAVDSEVMDEIRAVIADKPSYGYIRVWGVLRDARRSQGRAAVNRKRI
jgi:hypothetical protein